MKSVSGKQDIGIQPTFFSGQTPNRIYTRQERAPDSGCRLMSTLPSRQHRLNELLCGLLEIECSWGALSRATLCKSFSCIQMIAIIRPGSPREIIPIPNWAHNLMSQLRSAWSSVLMKPRAQRRCSSRPGDAAGVGGG